MKYLSLLAFPFLLLSCAKDEVTFPYSKDELIKIIENPFKYGISANVTTHTELDTFGKLNSLSVSAHKKSFKISSFTVNETIIPRVQVDTNAYLFQIFPNNPQFNSWGNNLIIKLNDQTKVIKPLQLSFDNLPNILKLNDKVALQTRESELLRYIVISEYDPWSNFPGKILYKSLIDSPSFKIDDNVVKNIRVGQRIVLTHLTTEAEVIDNILYNNSCIAISKSIIFDM